MRRAVQALWLCLATCGYLRCEEPRAVDAGQALPALERFAPVELRTALATLYPEFIGTTVMRGEARLTRQLRWKPAPASFQKAVEPLLGPLGFSTADAGDALAVRPPFELGARQTGDQVELTLRLPLGAEAVLALLRSPSPMSTQLMETLLPSPAGATTLRDRFDLELEYTAPDRRMDFLMRQLAELLVQGGWKPEPALVAGDELPRSFTLTFRGPQEGAVVRVQRNGERALLSYEKLTAQRR